MSQYKDTSLKDLLENFINAQYLGAFTDNRELEDNAEDEMQAIAGELNRRFYLTQEHNEALLKLVEALTDYLLCPHGEVGSFGNEGELDYALRLIRSKLINLKGEQP